MNQCQHGNTNCDQCVQAMQDATAAELAAGKELREWLKEASERIKLLESACSSMATFAAGDEAKLVERLQAAEAALKEIRQRRGTLCTGECIASNLMVEIASSYFARYGACKEGT